MSTSKNNSEVVRYAGASGFKGYGTDSAGRGAGGFKGYGSGGGDNYSQYDNNGNEYKYDKKLNAWVHWVTEPNGNAYPIFRDKDGNPTKVNPNQPVVANVQPNNAPPQISEEEKAARAVSDETAKRNKVVPKRKAPSSLLNVNEMFANAPAWGEEPDHAPTETENREHYWNGAKLVRFLNGGFAHLAKMRERGASQESINIVLNVIGRYMESTFREAYQRGGIGAVRSIERGLSGANANGVVHGIITQDVSALIRSGVCGLLKKYENLSADEYFKFAKHFGQVYNARVKDGGNVLSRENTERAKESIANTTQGVKDGEPKGNGKQEELSRVSVDEGRTGSGGRPGIIGLAERNRSEADAGRTEQSPDNGRGLGVHQDGEIARQTQVERPVRRRQLAGASAGRGGDQGITPEEAAREVSQEAQKEEEKPEEPKDRDGGLFDFANQNPEQENESEAETSEEPETEQEPVKTPVLEVSESFIKEPITSPSVIQGRAKPGLIDGTPATEDIENEKVYGVHVSKLHLDPARFQFKQNVDKKTGAGDSLAGAKFDRVQANTLLVWRDPADGLDYVVNGHHRFNLALQSGYDGYINVCYSRAKTAEEAKVDGAVANIVDGKGTEIDAADIIRVHPDIENDERVKGLVGDNIRLFKKGKALASLAPEIYDAMKKGFVAPHTILPLGEILPNDFDRQMLVWNKRVHPRPTIAANAVASAAMFAAGAKGRKIDNGNQMVFDFFSDATSFDEEFDQGSKLIEGIQRYLSSKRGVNAKLSRATNTDTLDENTLEGVIHNANAKQEAKGTTAVLDWLRENGYHKPGLVKDIFQDSLKKFLEIPVKDKKAQNACIRDAATKIQDAILHGRAEDLLRGLFASNNDNEEKNTDGLETVAGNDRSGETSVNASSLSQKPSRMAGTSEDGAVSAGDGAGMDRMADETAGEEPSGEPGDGEKLTSEPEPDDSPTAEATEVAEPTESADEISQSIVAEEENRKEEEPAQEEPTQEVPPQEPIEEPTQEQEPEQEAPKQLRPSLNLAGTPERVNFIANKALGKVQTLLDASKIYNKQSTIDAVRIIRTAFAQNNNDARCKEAEKAADHCILCLESLHEMKGTQERLSRENYLFNLRYRIRNIFNDGTKPTTEPTETAPKPDDTASEETKPVPETPEESAMEIGSEVEDTEPEQTEQAAMEVADEAEEESQEERTTPSANSGRGPDGYYKVNEDLARWANDANSYRDYKAGSANREYQSAVNVMRGIAERRKETCDDETRAKIDRLLDSYERKLANWYDRYYRNESYAPSILVAGGSNFPVKKKERQNNNRRTLWKEHEELNGKYRRLISGVGTGGISSDDKDAVPQLEAKLAALEKRQKDIVEANKYFRKNNRSWEGYDGPLKNIVERWSTGWGWPRPLMTTNNGAEIRRIKGRIEELNRKASSNFGDDLPFDGGRTTFNKADNRIEIYHDEKPSPETISELKHNGFKWSPKKKAWQRQITDNAIIAAKMLGYIPNTWEPTKEESAEPEPDEPTPTPQEPTQEVTPEAAARQVDADVKEDDTPSTPPDALFEGGTDRAEESRSEDDTPFFPGFEHDEKKKKPAAPKAKQDDDKPMTDEELHAAIQSYRPDLLDYEPLKDDEAPVSLLQFEHDDNPKEEQKEEETPEEAARTINAETSGDVTAPEPKQEDDEKKDRPFGESWNFKGGSVTPNYDKNRLEIRYDSVPSKKTLKMLEEDGFTVRRVKQEGRQLPQYVAMRKLNEAALQLCKDYGYTPINGGADKKKELTTTTEPKPEGPKPEPKPEDEPKPPQNPEERRRAWARAKEQSDWDKRMAIAEADVDRTRKRPINKTEHAFEPPKDWKSQVFTPNGEADGGIEPPKASRMTIARAAKRLHNAVAASADRNKAIETITSIIYPLSSYTDQIVNGQVQASGYQLNLAKRLNHLCGQLRDRAAIEAAINKSCASPDVLAKFLRGLASKVDLIYQPHDASFPELVYNPENLPKTPEEQAPAEPETSKDAAKDFEDDEETRKGIEATSGERSAYDWYGHAGVELAPEEWERYKEKRAVADDEWRKNKRKRLYQKTEENGENSTLQKTPTTSVSY